MPEVLRPLDSLIDEWIYDGASCQSHVAKEPCPYNLLRNPNSLPQARDAYSFQQRTSFVLAARFLYRVPGNVREYAHERVLRIASTQTFRETGIWLSTNRKQ